MDRVHKPAVGYLLLGGRHHLLHLIPVAAAMARKGEARTIVFATNDQEALACRSLMARLGAESYEIVRLNLPMLFRVLGRVFRKHSSMKAAILVFNRKKFEKLSCLVVAERTSTLLKRLPGRKPFLIHIPHGAGDRARGFEKRIRFFDHIIVAGRKDRRRMIEAGVASERNCSVSGYIKAAAISELRPATPRLFANSRPVVLYNPHFNPHLSTWRKHGALLLEAFGRQDRFNLIFAPHIRLFEGAPAAVRARIEGLAAPDRILIDLGSEKSTDMTYTRAADIYLGDVSSQVYEFLLQLRPCVFLSAGPVEWKDNPDFAHWRYGDVCSTVPEAMEAIDLASRRHSLYLPAQRAGVEEALGAHRADTLDRAASIIMDVLRSRDRSPAP